MIQKCVTPECNEKAGFDSEAKKQYGGRGLCKRCHNTARYMIRTGKTTWAELEKLGLARPAKTSAIQNALALRRKAEIPEGHT